MVRSRQRPVSRLTAIFIIYIFLPLKGQVDSPKYGRNEAIKAKRNWYC